MFNLFLLGFIFVGCGVALPTEEEVATDSAGSTNALHDTSVGEKFFLIDAILSDYTDNLNASQYDNAKRMLNEIAPQITKCSERIKYECLSFRIGCYQQVPNGSYSFTHRALTLKHEIGQRIVTVLMNYIHDERKDAEITNEMRGELEWVSDTHNAVPDPNVSFEKLAETIMHSDYNCAYCGFIDCVVACLRTRGEYPSYTGVAVELFTNSLERVIEGALVSDERPNAYITLNGEDYLQHVLMLERGQLQDILPDKEERIAVFRKTEAFNVVSRIHSTLTDANAHAQQEHGSMRELSGLSESAWTLFNDSRLLMRCFMDDSVTQGSYSVIITKLLLTTKQIYHTLVPSAAEAGEAERLNNIQALSKVFLHSMRYSWLSDKVRAINSRPRRLQ